MPRGCDLFKGSSEQGTACQLPEEGGEAVVAVALQMYPVPLLAHRPSANWTSGRAARGPGGGHPCSGKERA